VIEVDMATMLLRDCYSYAAIVAQAARVCALVWYDNCQRSSLVEATMACNRLVILQS
jgi:hypothetical protein